MFFFFYQKDYYLDMCRFYFIIIKKQYKNIHAIFSHLNDEVSDGLQVLSAPGSQHQNTRHSFCIN